MQSMTVGGWRFHSITGSIKELKGGWKMKMNLKILFLIIVFIMMVAVPLRADDKSVMELSMEQLMEIEVATVFGASKFEQKVTDAPASVSIVTTDEIKKYGYRTLGDILRSVRGFYVSYDRNYSFLGARGFSRPSDYNSRFLLLLDGHRLNDNIFDTAAVGTEFPVDVDMIERVEIIRGPSSSLYGASAFFGVINVISRRGLDMKGAEVAGSVGSQETYSGRLSYGNKYRNGLELMISGTTYKSGGARDLYFSEYDTPSENNGIANRADDDKSGNIYSKFSFRDLTLSASYLSREKSIPTGSYGTVFNDDRNRTVDSHGYVDLKYAHKFENQSDLTARAYFDEYKYRGHYTYSGATPDDPQVLNKDGATGQWAGGELMYTMRLLDRHMVTVGAEERYNLRQDQFNYDESPFLSRMDDQKSSNTYALYLQDEYHILPNLIFNVGLRYDHYDTFGGTANPRLALIYRPLEKSIIKLLYGSAFRAPNAYELYYTDNGVSAKPNPDLHPEKIKTYEMVYEQYLGENFRSSLSGFYYQIDDLITQQLDDDGLLIFRNVGKVESKGMEVEIEGKWANGLQGRVSYILQETKDQETGEMLTNSPRHLAKLNLLIQKKLFAGAELQYTSNRKTLAGETGGFTTTNLTLFSQNFIKGLDVSFSFYNLLDKKYADPGAGEHRQDTIEQDGRNYRLKLTYKF
jgi:outer membrane receptor for ferrienterochelin and colicins